MGNNIGGRRKRTKVMKMNGEILKLTTPIRVCDVVNDYPDHVLLDIKAAKRCGVRAKPLHQQYQLEPGNIYFLIQLPKLPVPEEEEKLKVTRRVKSGVNMTTAKDQLEFLKLSRRSVSDLPIVRPPASQGEVECGGPVRVKMRLLRAQVDKFIEEGSSGDDAEVTQKLIDLYLQHSAGKIIHGT